MNNYLSASDLENEANRLSNYSGYTGMGDPFLEFSGDTGSFMDSINSGKVYNLAITNGGSVGTLVALLCPGLISTAQGLIADGAFAAVGGGTGLSASGGPQPIALFNAFIQRYPTFVAGFKLTTTSAPQLEQMITVQKDTPFGSSESMIVNPSIYMSEANPNTQLITVPKPFQMDNQTKVSYPILQGATVNLGIIFGASLNIARALTNKVNAAQVTKASFSGR